MFVLDVSFADKNRVYVDRDGDMWVYAGGGWRYSTEEGFSDDFYSVLPRVHEPYTELAEMASQFIVREANREKESE